MMAHPFSDFLKFIGTDFERYILPIIPAGAKLAPESKLTPDHLGKIPGMWLADKRAWIGFKGWSGHSAYTEAGHLKLWQRSQAECGMAIAIGLNTKVFNVVDIDSDDSEIADIIERHAVKHLGQTPAVRLRHGSPRRVLVYECDQHTAPIFKRRFTFKDTNGAEHAVEFLAQGQQVVIEGPHAKGQMYHWRNGGLIQHREVLGANLITDDIVGSFFLALREWVEETEGLEKVRLSLPRGGNRGEAVKVAPDSAHVASDKEMLAKAIHAIDINDPSLDSYDTWCLLFRAMWAACGGDRAFYTEHILPWLRGNPENEEEEMEAKIASFGDSMYGEEYVYEQAAKFGFRDGVNAKAQETFAPDPPISCQNQDAQDSGDSGNDADAPPAGAMNPVASAVGTGPTPFPYTDMALADRFAAEHPDWKFTPDEGWMRLKSGVYVPDRTILYPIGQVCSAVGDPYRAQGPQQARIDERLKSANKHGYVERVLRAHPAMFARPEDFDIDPWLLNTPDYVFDLRMGTWKNHKEALERGILMRNQTAVTPDLEAYGKYEYTCPRFLEALHNMTEDEQNIALLGRHGAAGLVGTDLGQYLLFIYGQGGTGKSAFSDILMRIDGSYGTSGSTTLFMKQNDKRPFELGDIAHARALFVPETLKGMTWDDALICSMLGGVPIRVERKHRDSKHVRVFMSITITGNHLPHFITSSQPNKSGIDRRLLLLKVDKLLQGKIDDHYARKLVAEEGPAILMWFIQHAMEGYESLQTTGSFYGDTIKRAKAAAEAYKAKMSPHLQWMEEEDVILEPGTRTNAHQAWQSYKAWIKDDNPLHRETKREFRENLRDATNGAVTYGRFGDEWVFFGMTFKDAPSGENVVPFPPVGAIKDGRTDTGDAAKK
jgi:P4 family phage/plasmid primase-like protien